MRSPLSLLLAGAALCLTGPAGAQEVPQGPKNVPDFRPAFQEQTRAPEARSDVVLAVTPVAEGLEHPWGMAVLPDGAMLVTERPGRLRVIGAGGALRPEPVAGLPAVFAGGQGGLLDVAVGPSFDADRRIYWSYAKPVEGGLSATAVARGVLSADMRSVGEVVDIFVQAPASPTPRHYGSRLVFAGPDRLFVTTGERSSARERGLAQICPPATARCCASAPMAARRRTIRSSAMPGCWRRCGPMGTATSRGRRWTRCRASCGSASMGRRAGTS